MVVEYLITTKTLNYKKIKKESTKNQNIFCKVSSPKHIMYV